MFFFSSRRRHTRSKRDWSSDVCSSDLWRLPPHHPRNPALDIQCHFLRSDLFTYHPQKPNRSPPRLDFDSVPPPIPSCDRGFWTRSEERRVGKECIYLCVKDVVSIRCLV